MDFVDIFALHQCFILSDPQTKGYQYANNLP